MPLVPERVGLILNDGSVIELDNISISPSAFFDVAAEDMLRYENLMIATWHTHPYTEAHLSAEDFACFHRWPNYLHLILGTDGVRGYYIERGALLRDASETHPAWCFVRNLAERFRV